ncbi:Prolipoprotein diacylglyceryl transferase [Candidatus Cyrtobacter comes]|uniref:Phosphatidylglycerol--prolipoprotein diacylglyceryl transferase n=1 Tax=Candidatus Cyrtobacter comes TaxID=675776 RepID=A0ABU5L8K4_9RICK|nr:prolipoprotein diacylglyceryl transferase [Candidatus Cyrtobacter comes]MDZ5762447.1 Prolipoprotein diacylglyceryl transferase [Candidatus Cyrtobacter comes]
MAINLQYMDPEAIRIGPLSLKWYGISYALGILICCALIRKLSKLHKLYLPESLSNNIEIYCMIGIIFGGRIGYMLIYAWNSLMLEPMSLFYIWEGGMSFHGGLIGMILVILLVSYAYKMNPFILYDLIAVVVPLGLFFGRLANFINAELRGRPSDITWSVIFYDEDFSRHPSQLYEAFGEGILLFAIMLFLSRFFKFGSGFLSSAFLVLYSIIRAFLECYREPDSNIGFIADKYTMGQLLSIVNLIFGFMILVISLAKNKKYK